MKKNFGKILLLASAILVAVILIKNVDANMISSLKIEMQRYSGVNVRYIGLAGVFVVMSYLTGWMSSKKSQID